jgi:aerobic carbon-monoxide dehydrogenase small subunit
MPDRVRISVTVNGTSYTREVEARDLLVYFLREELGLTGTHVGCDTSQCGACSILLDGRAVKSCTLFAVQVDGRQLTTIEGLARDGQLHPLQEAFWNEHGLQCGFCTPGFIMTSVALLAANPRPSEAEIRKGLEGNLCRCTGYANIVKAVQTASQQMASVGVAPGLAATAPAAQKGA